MYVCMYVCVYTYIYIYVYMISFVYSLLFCRGGRTPGSWGSLGRHTDSFILSILQMSSLRHLDKDKLIILVCVIINPAL